jgi:hypothetical protein
VNLPHAESMDTNLEPIAEGFRCSRSFCCCLGRVADFYARVGDPTEFVENVEDEDRLIELLFCGLIEPVLHSAAKIGDLEPDVRFLPTGFRWLRATPRC